MFINISCIYYIHLQKVLQHAQEGNCLLWRIQEFAPVGKKKNFQHRRVAGSLSKVALLMDGQKDFQPAASGPASYTLMLNIF